MVRPFVFVLALSIGSAACGSVGISVKQKAVLSLQTSETALEAAHDLERALCFNSPATEAGDVCTNPVAATVGLNKTINSGKTVHVLLAMEFVGAFKDEVTAATILQTWKAGDPVPTTVTGYQTDITTILQLAQGLAPGASAFLAKVQTAVDAGATVAAAVGVK